jgi:hypothetical protein
LTTHDDRAHMSCVDVSSNSGNGMSEAGMSFRWCRYVQRHGIRHAAYQLKSGLIEPIGNPEEPYFEIETYVPSENMFAIFAKHPATAEGMIRFCNQYGCLWGARSNRQPVSTGINCATSSCLGCMLTAHAAIRDAYEGLESADPARLFEHVNGINGHGVPRYATNAGYFPVNLHDWMWEGLLRYHWQAKGLGLYRECADPMCRVPFRAPTVRAEYHSDKCRKNHNHHRKSNATKHQTG